VVKMVKIIKKPEKKFPPIEKIKNEKPFIFSANFSNNVSLKGFHTFRYKILYSEYEKNGFEDFWNGKLFLNSLNPVQTIKLYNILDLAEFGLVNTEVSEALECIRNNDYYNLGLECADVIIRVLNFCTRKNIPIEKRLFEKAKINYEREKKHGRKLI